MHASERSVVPAVRLEGPEHEAAVPEVSEVKAVAPEAAVSLEGKHAGAVVSEAVGRDNASREGPVHTAHAPEEPSDVPEAAACVIASTTGPLHEASAVTAVIPDLQPSRSSWDARHSASSWAAAMAHLSTSSSELSSSPSIPVADVPEVTAEPLEVASGAGAPATSNAHGAGMAAEVTAIAGAEGTDDTEVTVKAIADASASAGPPALVPEAAVPARADADETRGDTMAGADDLALASTVGGPEG